MTNAPAIEATGAGAIDSLFSPVARLIEARNGGRWFLAHLEAGSDEEDKD